MEQRAAHPEIDEKVIAIRADKASGGSEYKKTGEIDITRLLIKSKSDYKDGFITGTFTPLDEFCNFQMIQGSYEDELVAIVKERFPSYTIIRDDAGTLGVEIYDQVGKSYRIKRGAKTATALKKEERRDTKAVAEEAFDQRVAKVEANQAASMVFEGESIPESSTGHFRMFFCF